MGGTSIVETVAGTTMADVRAARDRATGDIVEIRLDRVSDPDVDAALEGRRRPVLITCRAAREGGDFAGSEQERLALLGRAIRAGADYVDVEWQADRRGLPTRDRTRLVLSHHDFDGTPPDLSERVRAMASEDADIVKVAVTPGRLGDCLTLRRVMAIDRPRVAIAMGSRGLLTRLCPWLWGSCWTYGGAAAPGQIPVADLRDVYRVHEGSVATTVYGVAGAPLHHSASPAMHNPALRASGLDAVYVTFETDDADELFEVAEAVGAAGLSVTAPLKASTFARTAMVDALSHETGSLNTLRRHDGRWEGRNFDVAGFLAPFDRRGRDLAGLRAVVLGGGGAARTAIWALRSRGALVAVATRRSEGADALAREFGVARSAFPPEAGWDLLVNTTPVGTWPGIDASPIPADAVAGGCVYDLIYNPQETTLLRVAGRAGAETIGGLEMLVGQACLQFEWWTGLTAPRDLMMQAAATFVARAQVQE